MMTPLPENAIAAAATSSVPARRELRCDASRLDPVGGRGEALGFVLVVLRAEERSLGGEQQRVEPVRIARRARVADGSAHRHSGEFELQRRVDPAGEGLAFALIAQ